jgi:arylsulfatase A-like enzyme
VAGIDVPAGIDGISFLPTLVGQGEQKKHDYLYWETSGKSGWQVMRRGNWKAHLQNVGNSAKTKFELYDLSCDIAEGNEISSAHPEVTEEMKRLMASARTVPQGNDEILVVAPPRKRKKK